jgi:hypothetical protein
MLDRPKAAARRAMLFRRRRREGITIIPVAIDEFNVLNALIDRRRLSEGESRDRSAVAAALERIIDDWSCGRNA